jgi:hypothetical protein
MVTPDTTTSEAGNTASDSKPFALVALDDFRTVDFQAVAATTDCAECAVLARLYCEAAHIAQAAGNDQKARVFGILASICGQHFKPGDPSGPLGPMWVVGGRRSAIPEDFKGAQAAVLQQLLPEILHPGLRARLAEMIWLNDRKAHDAGRVAIASYCETTNSLLDGRLKDQFSDLGPASMERLRLVERALQIAGMVGKRGQIPDQLTQTAIRLYDDAKAAKQPVPFSRIAKQLLRFDVVEPSTVARDAEAVARNSTIEATNPLAVKFAWDCAAHAYELCGADDAAHKCRLKGIDQTIAMRDHVSGAAAEAHWLRTAIAELRGIPGTQDQREELRIEMRQLQERSVDEVGSFQAPLDLADMRAGTTTIFGDLTLPMALGQFACLSESRTVDELRQEAKDGIENAPLMSMMGGVHYDAEGKITAETEGASTSGEPSEDWYKTTIARNLRFHRHVAVAGRIDPAREALTASYQLSEIHFRAIVTFSPFIPATHRHTFALGFARFMQGDFISAAHLLIPQLENSVRYVLHAAGKDSSKIMPDMLQEDRTLSALIGQFRPELERIFSAPIILEIELLFVHNSGPALRHDFAHGKAPDGACFDVDVIYACWFIYRLACIPLFGIWEKQLGPAIEADCF